MYVYKVQLIATIKIINLTVLNKIYQLAMYMASYVLCRQFAYSVLQPVCSYTSIFCKSIVNSFVFMSVADGLFCGKNCIKYK